MRITNPTNPTPILPSENPATQAPRTDSATSALPTPHAPSITPETDKRAPSFELLSLNASLQQVPAARSDVVAATMQRLASGQLRTADAIEQTARALLGN